MKGVCSARWMRMVWVSVLLSMAVSVSAQNIVDRCVQLHGGLGVKVGHPAEMLYREIRALRIYEGATEVQQVVIARETIKLLSGVMK